MSSKIKLLKNSKLKLKDNSGNVCFNLKGEGYEVLVDDEVMQKMTNSIGGLVELGVITVNKVRDGAPIEEKSFGDQVRKAQTLTLEDTEKGIPDDSPASDDEEDSAPVENLNAMLQEDEPGVIEVDEDEPDREENQDDIKPKVKTRRRQRRRKAKQ